MEFLQYHERQLLAWERCTDHFLDGETLAIAYGCGVRDCGRGGRLSLVGVGDVGYASGTDKDKWRKEGL